MKIIQGSVGRNGVNSRSDVITVQELINKNIDLMTPLRPLVVDGRAGPKTISAIEEFQRRVVKMRNPDGRVNPGGPTFQKLAGVSAGLPSTPTGWEGDSARWPEEKKLASLNPDFRNKVTTLLTNLRARGFQPRVFYGWRSVEVQKQLYTQRKSKILFSFHNAQTPDCKPNSYAADIIDSRYGWSQSDETKKFFEVLGEEANRCGLYWGGDWKSFPDPAHVQWYPNSKLGQVKKESGL